MAGALALGVLAACDPPAGSGTTTSSASPSGSASAAGQDKYQSCMAAAGWSSADISRLEGEIFQPSPSSTPDPSAEKFRGDLLRCQRDAGILPDDDNGGSVDPSAANVAIGSFVTCMRTRGWDLADPKPGPDGALVPPAPPENLGAQQEAFNTDQISCLSDSVWSKAVRPKAADVRGLGDTAYLAWMALRSRRLRTALATLGPLIGVLTIVATTTYSSSAAAQVDAALRQAGSDLVEVEAPQVPGENDPRLPAEALQRVLAVPGIESAAPLTRVSNATIAGNRLGGVQEAGALVINGTGPGLRAVAGVGLAQGRFLTASDENASAPVVVVGAKAAQILGVRPGIPQSVRIGDDDFGIVGVLTASTLTTVFDRSVFIPTSTARTILGVDPRPTSLMLRVDGDAVSHVVPALDRAITYGVGYPPRVMVPADLLRAQAEIDATLRWVILGTGGLALLVGGLGIANVLAMSVLERAPEIGVRRALGHSRGHVALQFVGEALLIGLLGGVIGAALAIGGVWAVISHRGWPLATSGPAIAAGILLGILVTALAALHPAVAAARMDPMRVLRPG